MKKMFCVLSLSVVVAAGCGKQAPPRDALAIVGDRAIDAKELTRSYALRPEWKRGQTELQSYLTQLRALETQKLYAQEAERLGLDRDSLMQSYLEFLKQKEMIKGLYQREVREKVQLTESEERRIYEWKKKKVDYRYVFARDSGQCVSFAKFLETREDAKRALLPDSSVRIGSKAGGDRRYRPSGM